MHMQELIPPLLAEVSGRDSIFFLHEFMYMLDDMHE